MPHAVGGYCARMSSTHVSSYCWKRSTVIGRHRVGSSGTNGLGGVKGGRWGVSPRAQTLKSSAHPPEGGADSADWHMSPPIRQARSSTVNPAR